MPDLIRARAEQQEEGDEDGDGDDSGTWFNIEKGSVVTLNSNTMKASISEKNGQKKKSKKDESSDDDDDGRGDTVQLTKKSV